MVERSTATWIVQTVGKEAVGPRGGVLTFESDVSIAEMLSALERISSVHGWQTLLKKAGMA